MKKISTLDMIYVALCGVIMAICSWISIPTVVPFTLQTFGVFLSVAVLGGKRGSLSVFIYLLLGAVGIPVFSGFKGGPGALLGTTGGYIIGFLLAALIMWAMEAWLGKSDFVLVISMVTGLLACYAFGTVWFMIVYGRNMGEVGLLTVLGWCVFPFILPDVIKIALALFLSKKIKKVIKLV